MWFILEYEAPITLTHYEFYSGDDTARFTSRQAQDWQLEASNDLENWVMLDALATQLATDNLGLAYRGPAFAPTATLGEVCVDVPAGMSETNATVVFSGGLRLAKEGAGTLVMALNGQSYVGGTVVREGVLKPGLAVFGDTPFGIRNTVMAIEEGAQYWDDVYSPWSTQNLRFKVAGTGPDGTGAIRTTHAATGNINNSEKGWLAALELTADAEIGRDAYAFSLIDNYWLEFPLKLNGHTLTFTSDTLTVRPNYPYLLASSLCGAPGDTGTIVIGDNIQFYPYQKYDSDISAYTLVITENASYSTNTDGYGRNLVVSNLIYRSNSELSQNNKLTTVVGCYAPESTTSAPKVQLGDANHLKPRLDVGTLAEAYDVAFGGGLTFFAGSTVYVDVGDRKLEQGELILSWTARPTGVSFKLLNRRGELIMDDEGLRFLSGLMVIVR